MKYTDKEIISGLKNNDIEIYKFLVVEYYKDLYQHAFKYLSNKEISEEIVQDVFIYLWDNRQKIIINTSLRSYLFISIRNKSINYLKSKYSKIKFVELDNIKSQNIHFNDNKKLEVEELNQLIKEAVNSLPPKCNIVFNLSRNSDMTYHEIAKELNISKETVKSQMGIALSKIREYLSKYWDDIPG